MSLKCDVTGSTDRVAPLPAYMQTETIKNVCFNVAIKMEKERVNPTVKESLTVQKPVEAQKEVVEQVKPKKKKSKKKAKSGIKTK